MGKEGAGSGGEGAGSGGRGGGKRGEIGSGKSVTIWVRNCFLFDRKLIENCLKRYH